MNQNLNKVPTAVQDLVDNPTTLTLKFDWIEQIPGSSGVDPLRQWASLGVKTKVGDTILGAWAKTTTDFFDDLDQETKVSIFKALEKHVIEHPEKCVVKEYAVPVEVTMLVHVSVDKDGKEIRTYEVAE